MMHKIPLKYSDDDLCSDCYDIEWNVSISRYTSYPRLGGSSIGDTVRWILTRLGTNQLWSSYAMKGRKGKKACHEMAICRVVINKC